jgi:hypothetical protein
MSRQDFDHQVTERLRRQARRLRGLRLVEGAAAVAGIMLLAVVVQLGLDWWLRLPRDMRAALLVMILGVAGFAAWRYLIKPLGLRFGARELALAVERKHPELNSVLLSAVDFDAGAVGDPSANSPELVRAVIAEATAATRDVPIEAVINPRRSRQALLRGLGILAVVVVALTAAPRTLGIWWERNLLLRDVSWPQRTVLVVEAPDDGMIRAARGDDLDIRAEVAAGYVVPRHVEIVYRTASGKTGRDSMTGVGERGFRAGFPRVREDFTFQLEGGDDITDTFSVRLSERPRIAAIRLTGIPPAYTHQPAERFPDDRRAVELLRGGTLEITADVSKPLAGAALTREQAVLVELGPVETRLETAIVPVDSQTYHFALRDHDGLTNVRPLRFSVRVVEDATPEVRMLTPRVGNLVTMRAVLPIDLNFTDDWGLARAELAYRHSGAGGALRRSALPGFTPRATEFATELAWAVADAGASIGDEVTLIAEAEDFNDVSGPGIGKSNTKTFRIATDDELLEEFHRREQEYRRQFDRLVENQERLRRNLLTALARADDPTARAEWEVTLAPLERRQRQIMAQVKLVRQQFAQVLAEMTINRLDDATVRTRLQEGIIDPLAELGTREMSAAADQLRQLARQPAVAAARAVDPAQAQLLARMRAVLDNMLKWEGYQETVSMVREILRLQRELNEETRATLEESGGDFFED